MLNVQFTELIHQTKCITISPRFRLNLFVSFLFWILNSLLQCAFVNLAGGSICDLFSIFYVSMVRESEPQSSTSRNNIINMDCNLFLASFIYSVLSSFERMNEEFSCQTCHSIQQHNVSMCSVQRFENWIWTDRIVLKVLKRKLKWNRMWFVSFYVSLFARRMISYFFSDE